MLLGTVKSGPLIKARQFAAGPGAGHSSGYLAAPSTADESTRCNRSDSFFVMEDKIALCFDEPWKTFRQGDVLTIYHLIFAFSLPFFLSFSSVPASCSA